MPNGFTSPNTNPTMMAKSNSSSADFPAQRKHPNNTIDPAICNRCVQPDSEKDTLRTPNRCPPNHKNIYAYGADARSVASTLYSQRISFAHTMPQHHQPHRQGGSRLVGPDTASSASPAPPSLDSM